MLIAAVVLAGCGGSSASRGQPDAASAPGLSATSAPIRPTTMPPTPSTAVALPLAARPAAPSTPATPLPTPAPLTRIAVIGDYGLAGAAAESVASLVKGWHPDVVITVGDNNYPHGGAATIDPNVGQYYHEFIAPYTGRFGVGSDHNRFFPTLGNHDWQAAGAEPYLDYFTLPGNERYYAVSVGPVRLFALDSWPDEPDGASPDSRQAQWLRQELAESAACWNIVYMHHAPFSSGLHGSSPWMQWPYQEWGADAVLAGHDHHYERIMRDGLPYIVNGLGGATRYVIGEPIAGSAVQYQARHGALLIEAGADEISFQFVTDTGDTIDTYQRQLACSADTP